jgi:hypothetical protein
MATGALGSVGVLALSLFGLVSVVRARRAKGQDRTDPAADRRQAERAEMERRMASYLAARDDSRGAK